MTARALVDNVADVLAGREMIHHGDTKHLDGAHATMKNARVRTQKQDQTTDQTRKPVIRPNSTNIADLSTSKSSSGSG